MDIILEPHLNSEAKASKAPMKESNNRKAAVRFALISLGNPPFF
jgi:hypothetical protein